MHGLTHLERCLVGLDEQPFSGVYRAALGAATIPAWAWVANRMGWRDWSLIVFFAVLLLLLRLLPAVLRRLVPFPSGARQVWAIRRRWGREFDSYQWQKLFWFGLGVGVYVVCFGDWRPAVILLAGGCLVAGGAGLSIWQRTRPGAR